MRKLTLLCSVAGCTFAVMPATFAATPPTVANPICKDNTAFYDPGNGQDIVVPPGYTVSVFKGGLNFPTGIAFRRARHGDDSVVHPSSLRIPTVWTTGLVVDT